MKDLMFGFIMGTSIKMNAQSFFPSFKVSYLLIVYSQFVPKIDHFIKVICYDLSNEAMRG